MEDTMPNIEEERGEPMSGFMAFKALGIATAVVFGSAGLGAFVVAKLLGVDSVRPSPSSCAFSPDVELIGRWRASHRK
jgi:hypothetical protein